MDGAGVGIHLNAAEIVSNSSQISSSTHPPPPSAHCYPPLKQNGTASWHQGQNKLDCTHQHHHVSEKQSSTIAYGILKHEDDVLYITQHCIDVGRNLFSSQANLRVGQNGLVSRKHFQVRYDQRTCDFYVSCLSKNGIFVDEVFQGIYDNPMKLPNSCSFRFPSTEIRILFQSFVASSLDTSTIVVASPSKNKSYDRTLVEQKCSDHGTDNMANSRPTSSRQCQELFPSTCNFHEKPPYTYAQLIVQSISAAHDEQLTLSEIYLFISKHYPYYRIYDKGWKNSIRHNLSLNTYFVKVARSTDLPGKGNWWRIDPKSKANLIEKSYKKTRQHAGWFRLPGSVPVSPSRKDNSPDCIPPHDVDWQSVPGSESISYQR